MDHEAHIQKAVPSTNKEINPDSASQKVVFHSLAQTRLPLLGAEHRLRIRRKSKRHETVELLAMLDELLKHPAHRSRKAAMNR
jgi:hypothetical protein